MLGTSLHTDSHTQIHTTFLNPCISFSVTSMFINTSELELLFILVTHFELNVYILKVNIWFFWNRVLKHTQSGGADSIPVWFFFSVFYYVFVVVVVCF